MNFSMILAVDDALWFWKNGQLPWRIKEDMAYFRDITTETSDENKVNVVIMGRKTWESIPDRFRPLPDRINYVLTTDENYEDNGCVSYTSLEQCLGDIDGNPLIDSIFIIWGAQLYNGVLDDSRLEKIYLTKVDWDFGCDVFFDGVPDSFVLESEWEEKEEGDIKFKFQVYKKAE